MANTGNIIVTEKDMNPFSPTYNQERTRTYQDYERCGVEPKWTELSYYCEVEGTLNTGKTIIKQRDTNPNSPTYNQERTIEVYDNRCIGNFKLRTIGNSSSRLFECDEHSEIPWSSTDYTGYSEGDPVTLIFGECVSVLNSTWTARASIPNVEKIVFGNLSSTYMDPIGGTLFGGTKITEVDWPNARFIANRTFSSCTKLETVKLGADCEYIGERCFSYCSKLKNVTIMASNPPSLFSDSFSNTNNNFVIYVPAESVDTYKTTTYWSDYASRIQPIQS